MMAAAYVLGYLAARPSWLIAYACASAVVTVALLYYALDDGRALSPADAATAAWVTRLRLHNYGDEWWQDEKPGNLVPGFLPAPPAPPAPPQTPPASRPSPEAPPAAGEAVSQNASPPPVHLPWQRFSALAVLAAFTAPVRAHVDAAEQAKRDALQEEALAVFPPWEPWAGDETLTRMRAIKEEVA